MYNFILCILTERACYPRGHSISSKISRMTLRDKKNQKLEYNFERKILDVRTRLEKADI